MSQKYYQPIKHGTYVRFKSDRIDETRIINPTPGVPHKQVKDVIKVIHSNFHYLSAKSQAFHKTFCRSIVVNITNNWKVTEKQYQHLLNIKKQIEVEMERRGCLNVLS